jgi:hypothetical protein
MVVGETKLNREGAALDALVGEVRLVAMWEEKTLLRWECSDVGRLSNASRGEPGMWGEGKLCPGESRGLLLFRRCALVIGLEIEAGGLGGAVFASAAHGAKGGGRTAALPEFLSNDIASGECWGVGRRSRGLSCDCGRGDGVDPTSFVVGKL